MRRPASGQIARQIGLVCLLGCKLWRDDHPEAYAKRQAITSGENEPGQVRASIGVAPTI